MGQSSIILQSEVCILIKGKVYVFVMIMRLQYCSYMYACHLAYYVAMLFLY